MMLYDEKTRAPGQQKFRETEGLEVCNLCLQSLRQQFRRSRF